MKAESPHSIHGTRRRFVGLMGGASLSLLSRTQGLANRQTSKTSYLIETAHIAKTGGWKLDTQFHNVLGFSYLLAHGMGRPVENASTTVKLPQKGKYHVWVYCKDWCPGDWDAPGRFQVLVNGKALKKEFGTEAGWGWQSGGIVDVNSTETTIEVQDLTGFDGRCSAIYFSQDANDVPPADGSALLEWRMNKLGISGEPVETHDFDLVIVGGGIAGCAAALAAESQGLKVGLIQNRPVLGGVASGEIRVRTTGIAGPAQRFISKLDTPPFKNGSAEALDSDERRMANMAAAKGVKLFLLHTLIDANMNGRRIDSVLACEMTTGRIKKFNAPTFIDCTGDGWLGEMAGAEFMYGRESSDQYNEGWERYGDLWSPKAADNRVLGMTMLWNFEKMDRRVTFPDVPWAKPVAKEYIEPTGPDYHWEYSHNDLHQVDDAEAIRDHMLRAIYGTYANTIRQPKYANLKLGWVAFVGGKRESRRLVGDYVYTGVDARDSVKFHDAVVTEKRDIDIHYQRKLLGDPHDWLSQALYQTTKNRVYYIPFRSLYSKNIGNLMMAGRCFSCSHVGLGGPRVMRTCGQMGVATAFAAVLCKKNNADPRTVGKEHLKELRELCGYGDGDYNPPRIIVRKAGEARRSNGDSHLFDINQLSDELNALPSVVRDRSSAKREEPSPAFKFRVSAPATIYIAVQERGNYKPPSDWKQTNLSLVYNVNRTSTDAVYEKRFDAGIVKIPQHDGKNRAGSYGLPHIAFVKGENVEISVGE